MMLSDKQTGITSRESSVITRVEREREAAPEEREGHQYANREQEKVDAGIRHERSSYMQRTAAMLTLRTKPQQPAQPIVISGTSQK